MNSAIHLGKLDSGYVCGRSIYQLIPCWCKGATVATEGREKLDEPETAGDRCGKVVGGELCGVGGESSREGDDGGEEDGGGEDGGEEIHTWSGLLIVQPFNGVFLISSVSRQSPCRPLHKCGQWHRSQETHNQRCCSSRRGRKARARGPQFCIYRCASRGSIQQTYCFLA